MLLTQFGNLERTLRIEPSQRLSEKRIKGDRGVHSDIYIEHPQFEGFEVII